MNPKPSKHDSEKLRDIAADFFSDQPRGKARKGGTFKTGKRSKAPRNIASRKPVKR